ncbi:HAD-IA family hydrolase [Sphingomonas prati]|uniref:HAD-IA family hydrolase n=1 Tax=Sphingomonas prati TaxID=1843237 RepID=UPI00227C809F|nr:HAD-IA family hydrolase [Sphingomonas prati]
MTFDCYGTLVQWHRAVRQAARAILDRHLQANTSQERVAELASRLRAIAVEHQQQAGFVDYETVLDISLNQALSEAGYEAAAADFQMLLATLGRIDPHPEVPDALSRLRERYWIAIISNSGDDLIAGTVRAIGTPIDFVVTAQQARAYKPDHQLFLHAYATMGVSKDETIHVGMGQFTDLKVCQELGIRSVWIDREGEPLDPAWHPDATLNDLSGLPELLLPS